MNAAPTTQPTEPNVAGVRVRPGLVLGLYVLLLVSAALAPVLRVSPFIFLAFAVGFAARRYSAFKAFLQISLAALFFMLLLCPQAAEVLLLGDSAKVVRDAAHGALVRSNDGVEVGAANDPAALSAWKDGFS